MQRRQLLAVALRANPLLTKVGGPAGKYSAYLSYEGKYMREGKILTYPLVMHSACRDDRAFRMMVDAGLDMRVVQEVNNNIFLPPAWSDMASHLLEFGAPDLPITSTISFSFAWAERLMAQKHRGIVGLPLPAAPHGDLETASRDTFPGIQARHHGYATKQDAMSTAWDRAYTRLLRIYAGEELSPFPVAMFGRGKVVSRGDGDTATLLSKRRGRLVLAPEVDDHLILQAFSAPCSQIVKEAYKEGVIMYGASPFNRGGTIFLANVVADLCPDLMARLPWHREPDLIDISRADKAISAFIAQRESEYVYIQLDFSRYDAHVSTEMGKSALMAFYNMYDVRTKRDRRSLGRAFRYIEELIQRPRIATPGGNLYRKFTGNTTGSPFTTLYNSWTDGTAVFAALHFLMEGQVPGDCTIRVHGDDNLIVIPKRYHDRVNLESLTQTLYDGFGLVVNQKESREGTHLVYRYGLPPDQCVKFLGRYYMEGGACWRPLSTTVEHIVHPDTEDFSLGGTLTRCNGLLLDNPFNEEAVHALMTVMDECELAGGRIRPPTLRDLRKYVHGWGLSMDTFARGQRMNPISCRDLYCLTETQRLFMPSYSEGPIDYLMRKAGEFRLVGANWIEGGEDREVGPLEEFEKQWLRSGRSKDSPMSALRTIELLHKLKDFVQPGRRALKRVRGFEISVSNRS